MWFCFALCFWVNGLITWHVQDLELGKAKFCHHEGQRQDQEWVGEQQGGVLLWVLPSQDWRGGGESSRSNGPHGSPPACFLQYLGVLCTEVETLWLISIQYQVWSMTWILHMELLVFPFQVSMDTHGSRGPGKLGQVPVHNRQEKVFAVNAGVHRRTGVRMQVVFQNH